MKSYKNRGGEDLFRRKPIERTHGKIVIVSIPNSKLFLEVFKGEELVVSIEILVILTVAAFDLSVVPWRVRLNKLVPDAELF